MMYIGVSVEWGYLKINITINVIHEYSTSVLVVNTNV